MDKRGRPQLDLTGQRFGRLEVVAFARVNRSRNACWLCRCDCGKERVVSGHELRRGRTSSCGCWRSAVKILLNLKHGHKRAGSETPEYRAWHSMISRCTNPKLEAWKYYGGRGITVCDRWKNSFEAFLADMGPRPSPNLSIDRFPNNDGNYEPGNCRWATRSEQRANQRPARKAA